MKKSSPKCISPSWRKGPNKGPSLSFRFAPQFPLFRHSNHISWCRNLSSPTSNFYFLGLKHMITNEQSACPKCGGALTHYDTVGRIVRTKARMTEQIKLRRSRCAKCRALHRVLPETVLPYKQYEAEIIHGVLEGLITCETLGFEDYPCEMTMDRWRAQKTQLLLWR